MFTVNKYLCKWLLFLATFLPNTIQATSVNNWINSAYWFCLIIPPVGGGGGWGILESPCPSVCLSVCPSVCRRHGFRIVTQVCFGISIWNFICMLLVAMGRTLLIFSDVTFKIIFDYQFPDSNFSLALNITCVYGKEPIDFQQCHFQNGRLAGILDFAISGLCRWHAFWSVTRACFGISISNFMCMLFVSMGRSLLIFRDVPFKMAAWWPYLPFRFPDSNFCLALNIKSKLQ